MKYSKTKRSLIIVTLLTYHPTFADTNFYRWQDTQGTWHFSDKPPNLPSASTYHSKITEQDINTSISPHYKAIEPAITRKNKLAKSQQKVKDKAQKIKQLAKQAQTCHTLKSKLSKIQKKLRTGYKEPNGNRLRAKRRKITHEIYRQC